MGDSGGGEEVDGSEVGGGEAEGGWGGRHGDIVQEEKPSKPPFEGRTKGAREVERRRKLEREREKKAGKRPEAIEHFACRAWRGRLLSSSSSSSQLPPHLPLALACLLLLLHQLDHNSNFRSSTTSYVLVLSLARGDPPPLLFPLPTSHVSPINSPLPRL